MMLFLHQVKDTFCQVSKGRIDQSVAQTRPCTSNSFIALLLHATIYINSKTFLSLRKKIKAVDSNHTKSILGPQLAYNTADAYGRLIVMRSQPDMPQHMVSDSGPTWRQQHKFHLLAHRQVVGLAVLFKHGVPGFSSNPWKTISMD